MGVIVDAPYRLEMFGGGYHWSGQTWHTRPRPMFGIRADGPATDAGLAAYMEGFIKSMEPGGANEHLGGHAPTAARLVKQSTGDIVAKWGDWAK